MDRHGIHGLDGDMGLPIGMDGHRHHLLPILGEAPRLISC
jgi:hypothetical protein